MVRVDTQAAYILHKRAYRETSQIVDVFSREHGRLSLLSRGSRGARSRTSGLLQLFQPLVISWQGRSDLPYLNKVEMADCSPPRLQSRSLMSAMYINELLVNLLHRNDVHEDVFDRYHALLYDLQSSRDIEPLLRSFEKDLLQLLGFAMNLECDADSGEPLDAASMYAYHFEHGPVLSAARQSQRYPVVAGESLIAFRRNELDDPLHRGEIKTLMRYVMSHHLGGKRLKSRDLFRRSSGSAAKRQNSAE